mmetsp:Transcript_80447/g.160588  ORF Transcript_80447/g.160588 Transcript_80447/m.160588 type:complete len:232 (-) Transcript_80447:305-1000(-)
MPSLSGKTTCSRRLSFRTLTLNSCIACVSTRSRRAAFSSFDSFLLLLFPSSPNVDDTGDVGGGGPLVLIHPKTFPFHRTLSTRIKVPSRTSRRCACGRPSPRSSSPSRRASKYFPYERLSASRKTRSNGLVGRGGRGGGGGSCEVATVSTTSPPSRLPLWCALSSGCQGWSCGSGGCLKACKEAIAGPGTSWMREPNSERSKNDCAMAAAAGSISRVVTWAAPPFAKHSAE